MKLDIQGICKKYGKLEALKDVSFVLNNGVYGVLGPNGAGKSTLIQIIAGNLQPSAGKIFYDGKDTSINAKGYKRLLGYVPQKQGMYDNFSARKFLEYMAVLKGIKKQEIVCQVEQVLRIVDLWEVANRKLGGFSGGMIQRILIAQALIGNPEIIIMDEPTAGIDPKERIKIRNYISRISEGKIILLATHVVSDVESIAKEIILLGGGVVKKKGTVKQLCESIDGYVFECVIKSQDNYEKLETQFAVSKLQEMPEGYIKLRLLGEEQKVRTYMRGNPIKKVFPDLQEVYLSVFDQRMV